jgi:hypothetical protein
VQVSLFREINLHIARMGEGTIEDEELEFVCECSDLSCVERISLGRDEFVKLAQPDRRIVILAHVDGGTVVEQHARFAVLQDAESR